MKRLVLLTIALGLVIAPVSAQRLTVDLRGAVAAPTSKLAGADLGAGIGFGGTLAWRLQRHLHVYGGWDWMHFTADDAFAGPDRDIEETGYTLGLRFEHPVRETSRTSYRLEAGATFKHIEVEDDEGDIVADTDHGVGFEVGAGLLQPIGDTWHLAPTLRYRALSRDFNEGTVATSGNLRYVALEIGLSRRF